MTDDEALALGKELARLVDPSYPRTNPGSAVHLISLGRIAVKLSEPYVLEKNREASDRMTEAGMVHTADPCWQHNVGDAWRAMIDARLEEIKGK